MTFFADSVADLRYERGVVSFRLHARASQSSGVEVCLPVAEFLEAMRVLTREIPKIETAHTNWLSLQLEQPAQQDSLNQQNEPAQLGKRLASV